jgi:hypothetical protein
MTSPTEQKLKVTGPTVITANRLSDGKVIYRMADGGWTTRLEAAIVVTTTEAARELLAAAARDYVDAVGPYAAPVEVRDGRIEPGNLRERIRTAGPTFELPGSSCPPDVPARTTDKAPAQRLRRSSRKPSGPAIDGGHDLDPDGYPGSSTPRFVLLGDDHALHPERGLLDAG